MSFLDQKLIFEWNNSVKHKKPVEIQDETLRDGLQASYVRHPATEEKIQLLDLMEKIGIHGADIGYPATGKRNFNDVVKIGKHKLKNGLKINLSCAARTVISDIEPIIRASEKIGYALESDIFIASSQLRKIVEQWNLGKMRKLVKNSVEFAVKNNLPVMFVTEDTTRAKPKFIADLYKVALESGANRICITDTVGYATPESVRFLLNHVFTEVVPNYKNVKVDWHGHNDRGLETANALVAAELGVDRIHGTALGVGERSGNMSMHKLLVNLDIEGYTSNLDLKLLSKYSKYASKILKVSIPINEPIIGGDSFTTASGVHASATMKALKMNLILAGVIYTGVDPLKIGREVDVRVGPFSGKSNVEWVLSKLKIKKTEALIKKILSYVKKENRILSNSEVKSLLKEIQVKRA